MKLDPLVWGSIFPELVKPDDPQMQPILGFRINRVHLVRRWWGKPSVVLRSVGPSGYEWEPGRNEAICLLSGRPAPGRPRHLAPAVGCHCGLYACHDLQQMRGFTKLVGDYAVLAGVAGTGIVRIHEFGWRAQYARIVAFSLELPEMSIVPHVRAQMGQKSLPEEQILRLLGYDEKSARAQMARDHKQLSPGIARALEDKYQVPVVPLEQLKMLMTNRGTFWEEMK